MFVCVYVYMYVYVYVYFLSDIVTEFLLYVLHRALQVLAFLQGVHHSLSSKDLDTIADLTFSWSGSDIEVC